jgi:hypothetical protein
MEYKVWITELFSHGPPYDPWKVEHSEAMYAISLDEAFDHLDRMLDDKEIHNIFNSEQLALGLSMAFSNCLTDFPFCYLRAGTEERRIRGIHKLKSLYDNFFARYCLTPYTYPNSPVSQRSSMQYLCENFWDLFVLFPSDNVEASHIDAGLDVMEHALGVSNDHCISSGLGGIADWAYACELRGMSRPRDILLQWNSQTSEISPDLKAFGRQMLENVLS